MKDQEHWPRFLRKVSTESLQVTFRQLLFWVAPGLRIGPFPCPFPCPFYPPLYLRWYCRQEGAFLYRAPRRWAWDFDPVLRLCP